MPLPSPRSLDVLLSLFLAWGSRKIWMSTICILQNENIFSCFRYVPLPKKHDCLRCFLLSLEGKYSFKNFNQEENKNSEQKAPPASLRPYTTSQLTSACKTSGKALKLVAVLERHGDLRLCSKVLPGSNGLQEVKAVLTISCQNFWFWYWRLAASEGSKQFP